jgi:hypothetical protein
MPNEKPAIAFPTLAAMAVALMVLYGHALCSALPAGGLAAQSSPASVQEGSSDLEESLFVVDPQLKNAKGAAIKGALSVVSIPEPIQKYCMGKTTQECSTIDYCIRTTTKSVAMCQNLPASLRRLPPYPAGMLPRRVYSITFFQGAPNIKGFDALRRYYDSAPTGSFDHLSMHSRIKARVRITRKPGDDDFDLLEVLAVPFS